MPDEELFEFIKKAAFTALFAVGVLGYWFDVFIPAMVGR
jgi:hypothetical protein